MKREREYTKFKKKKKTQRKEVMQGSKKKRPINLKMFKLIFLEKVRYWVRETTVNSFKRSDEETREGLEF